MSDQDWLPLRSQRYDGDRVGIIGKHKDGPITVANVYESNDQSMSEFIVTACNAFESMKKALGMWEDFALKLEEDDPESAGLKYHADKIKATRAAIALAEKGAGE